MRQRGPDHAEYRRWLNPAGNQVLLLHTRLSIIDLEERSNQPFQWDNNCIVYNGELYNYVELRQERAARGVAYRTQSDTEVLLGIINQEGWGGLERCEGMWAFAVYDEEKGVLSLCRDRFGEKPLYVYRDATGFYFGSEVKFITALLGRSLPVNMEHLYRYLVNGYKSLYKNGETFFQGLRELEPGTVLHLEAQGGERQEVFWEPR